MPGVAERPEIHAMPAPVTGLFQDERPRGPAGTAVYAKQAHPAGGVPRAAAGLHRAETRRAAARAMWRAA